MLIGSLVSQGQAQATFLGSHWTKALSLGNIRQAVPSLIRQLWQPVQQDHEIDQEPFVDRHELRSQLRQSMELYEHGVKRTSLDERSTPDDVVSAITQLVYHGEGNTQFNKAAAARGLHIAVGSLVEARTDLRSAKGGSGKRITDLHMAQELVYSCLGYYLPAESGQPVPMLNLGDCRHSTSLITQALSQHEPAEVTSMLRTMIHAAGDQSRVGSVTAAAMVRACMRSRFRGMTSKIYNLPPKAGRRKTQLDRRFHAMIKFANTLHRYGHPPPCLFQAMITSAVATDVYHWNRMRISCEEKQAKRSTLATQHPMSLNPNKRADHSQGACAAVPTSVLAQAVAAPKAWTGTMPIAFVLSHDDSHTRRVLSMRRASAKQCISDRLAIELLGLARSEQDVAKVLHELIFPAALQQPPSVWVDHASGALVSAAVNQYVFNQAWSSAMHVLERAMKVDRWECSSMEPECAAPTLEDPFSVLDLQHSASHFRTGDSATVAANTLLCSAAAMAATRLEPSSPAAASANETINTTLLLSQVHGIPLFPHTVRQVFLCALHKQRMDGTADPSAVLHACEARRALGTNWSTLAHALIIAGDDGCRAVSLVESMLAETALGSRSEVQASIAGWSAAAAYAVVRAPSAKLPDRLRRFRHILSALPANEMDQFPLQEQLARAAVAAFFRHPDAMLDLSQHGLQLLLSELLAAGLPFTGHLQKCLARHMHVLSVALVRHRVHDAAALELKSGVGRLAVGDVHFAGSIAGRRCVSRAAAVNGQNASSVFGRSIVDDTPYYTDGRISSTGFAIFPATADEVLSECQQVAAGWLPPAGGDVGGLCRQMPGDLSPSPLTAEFLSNVSAAASLCSVDWMAVAENKPVHAGADLLLPSGEERFLQQALALSPEQWDNAWHAVSTAARLMQAVPPE